MLVTRRRGARLVRTMSLSGRTTDPGCAPTPGGLQHECPRAAPGTALPADLWSLLGRFGLAWPSHANAWRLTVSRSLGTGVPAARQRAAIMSADH